MPVAKGEKVDGLVAEVEEEEDRQHDRWPSAGSRDGFADADDEGKAIIGRWVSATVALLALANLFVLERAGHAAGHFLVRPALLCGQHWLGFHFCGSNCSNGVYQ